MSGMRIGIDARAWRWEGIGRYIRNLVPELAALARGHEYVVGAGTGDYEAVRQELAGLAGDSVRVVPVEGSYYSWQEHVVLPRQLGRLQADLWHFTHFNVPVWWRTPYVVTIHDTIRFVFPGEQQQSLYQQVAYEYVFRRAVERARAIITVSQATAQDLADLPFKLPWGTTIYEGVAERFWEAVSGEARANVRQWLGVAGSYLLFVGVAMNHKNILRLLEAWQATRQRHPELTLVLAGRLKQGRARIEEQIERLGLRGAVQVPGFVPDALLPALYAEAEALVFPSLYEGFGLPALEAQAVGVPVVAANVTSLPELLGEAAVYVNPESVSDIERGMGRVLMDVALRERLVRAGRGQAQRFTWQEAARRHVEVYERAGATGAKNSGLRT